MIRDFNALFEQLTAAEKQIIAVVSPEDLETLKVIEEARDKEYADFILIGHTDELQTLIKENKLNLHNIKIIHEPAHDKAGEKAVRLVKEKEAHAIMKGLVHTSTFLRPILNKDTGFNLGKKISQISISENTERKELMFITDGAMTISPDLMDKKRIIENAVSLAHELGYEKPKVAALASLENVNPAMSDTIDAALLSKMNDRGQLTGCIVDGPLAYDNAVSEKAATQKKVGGPVAGQAQILLVPNITVGNVLTKSLVHDSKKILASAVVGLDVPLVFTSRTESREGKLATIALASYLSLVRRKS